MSHPLLVALALAATSTLAHAADPTAVGAPTLQTGDGWVFDQTYERGVSGFSERRVDLLIERVGADRMVVGIKPFHAPVNYEDHAVGLDWRKSSLLDGRETTTGRPFDFPMTVGKTWRMEFTDPRRHGLQTSTHNRTVYKVVGWEDVVVPAGTFRALKIDVDAVLDATMEPAAAAVGGVVASASSSTTVTHTDRSPGGVVHATTHEELYYVPVMKYFVKSIEEQYNSDNVRTLRQTQTLVSSIIKP